MDFGYSFSQEETFEKWGRREILGDYVRHIRTLRPDVLVTMSPDGMGGGQHHQASAVLATEAFRAAADLAQFPEQIREGLRPWQVKKLYRPAGGFGGRGGRGRLPLRVAAVRGAGARGKRLRFPPTRRLRRSTRTSTSRCSVARSARSAASRRACTCVRARAHGATGTAIGSAIYRLIESMPPKAVGAERSLFDGIDVSLGSLARYAGDRAAGGDRGAR